MTWPATPAPPAPRDVTIDRTGPTVVSIARTGAASVNTLPVSWTVTFSEPVSGVTASNFTLSRTGLSGALPTISTVSPTGGSPSSSWTVTTTTTTATAIAGSIRLDLTNPSPIIDTTTNALATPSFTGDSYSLRHGHPHRCGGVLVLGGRELHDWRRAPGAGDLQRAGVRDRHAAADPGHRCLRRDGRELLERIGQHGPDLHLHRGCRTHVHRPQLLGTDSPDRHGARRCDQRREPHAARPRGQHVTGREQGTGHRHDSSHRDGRVVHAGERQLQGRPGHPDHGHLQRAGRCHRGTATHVGDRRGGWDSRGLLIWVRGRDADLQLHRRRRARLDRARLPEHLGAVAQRWHHRRRCHQRGNPYPSAARFGRFDLADEGADHRHF